MAIISTRIKSCDYFIFLQPLDLCEFGNTTSAFAAGQINSNEAFRYYLRDNIRNNYLFAALVINVENVSLVYKAYTFDHLKSYGTTIIVVSVKIIWFYPDYGLIVHSRCKSSNDEEVFIKPHMPSLHLWLNS